MSQTQYSQACHQFRQSFIFFVRMAKISTREPKNFVEQLLWKISKPNTEVKTNFYRLMAVSQEAGLGMRETLKGIAFAETNDAMKTIINEVLKDVNE
jgi:type II secretory pathway component PulF